MSPEVTVYSFIIDSVNKMYLIQLVILIQLWTFGLTHKNIQMTENAVLFKIIPVQSTSKSVHCFFNPNIQVSKGKEDWKAVSKHKTT